MKYSEFPLEIFPLRLQEHIARVSYVNLFSEEFYACSVLSACATAIGNSYAINVKDSWIEKASLFICIIGLTGINKSGPPPYALKPIQKREKEIYRQYKEYVKEWEKDPNEKKKLPILTKTILQDATQESVVMQLQNNPRGILIFYDELSGFLKAFNRYNNGNEEQFYLSVWSGKEVVVDRKTQISIRIDEPLVNILGTIQPEVFDQRFKGKEESGFTDRWLICYPNRAKKEAWNNDTVPQHMIDYYFALFDRMHRLNMRYDDFGEQTSNILKYSKDAFEFLSSWQRMNTDEINNTTSNTIRGIRSKMETYINRFALIIHLIDHCDRDEITPPLEISYESVKKAAMLAKYFTENGTRTREGQNSSELYGVWKEIYDMLPDYDQPFTTMSFIQYASIKGMSEISSKRFLKRNTGKLFEKVKHGVYSKI